ncbi:hypothetical protein ACTXT7_012686 [Hymenolepis weldensis]
MIKTYNKTVCLFPWHPHPQATSLPVCIALTAAIYQSFFFKLIDPATGGNNKKPERNLINESGSQFMKFEHYKLSTPSI